MDKLLGNLQGAEPGTRIVQLVVQGVDLVDASLYLSIGWIIHEGDTALLGRLNAAIASSRAVFNAL